MKIFIGSSRENEDLVGDIAVWLEERDHEAIPWNQPGLFPPGEQTMNVLIEISQSVKAAILIFGADDRVWYRMDTVRQPRDNVLIEYGLFAGALGPQRTVVCQNGDVKHPVDLAGLTYVDLSPARRERGKRELSIWARKLTTPELVDPTVLSLQAKIAVLEGEKELLNRRLGFESDKAQDLSNMLSKANVTDFSRYDLEADGHWKLLFDYTYFHGVAAELAGAAGDPVGLRKLFHDAGAENLSEQIAWHNPGDPRRADPDRSATRTEFLARKVLRLFRRDPREADAYREFVGFAYPDVEDAINGVAARAISLLGSRS